MDSRVVDFVADPAPALLAPDEPPPFHVEPAPATHALLLCDHASAFVPRALDGLGLPADALQTHIALDLHAAELTRALASRLGLTAIFHGISRLVTDANRDFDDPSCWPIRSDGQDVPGNRALDRAARRRRWQQLHQPYHDAIRDWLAPRIAAGESPAILSMHSFTPHFPGQERPWPVGVLWDEDGRLALPFMESLRARGVLVGDNEPYSGRGGFGYTMGEHAVAHDLPHLLIEVRQDVIADAAGRTHWADVLAEVLQPLIEPPRS